MKNKRIQSFKFRLNHNTLVQTYIEYDSIIFNVGEEENVRALDLESKIENNLIHFQDYFHITKKDNELISNVMADFANNYLEDD